MRRPRALALALVTLTAPLPAHAAAVAWSTDLAAAVRLSESTRKPLLVDLYADWCSWCKVLEKEVFADPAFVAFARDFVPLRIDIEDGGEGTSLYQRYGAVTLPTTLIVDSRLAIIAAVEGYQPAPQFLELLRREIERHGEYLRRVERALFPTADAATRRRAATEARQRADGARAAPIFERLVAAGAGGLRREDLLALGDAYRLDRRFDEATSTAQSVRREAAAAEDRRQLERADLLLASIARERGDCPSARQAYEAFLREHPRSSFAGHAQRVLKSIAPDGSGRCA